MPILKQLMKSGSDDGTGPHMQKTRNAFHYAVLQVPAITSKTLDAASDD